MLGGSQSPQRSPNGPKHSHFSPIPKDPTAHYPRPGGVCSPIRPTATTSTPKARPLPKKKVVLALLPPAATASIESAYTFFTNDPLEIKGQSGRTWGPDWTVCVNSWVTFQELFKFRVSLYANYTE